MDGLSNAASAVAIVSLALHLVDTVRKITRFLDNVQDAPKEVLGLIETLDQLQGTLNNVRQLIDQQFLVLRLPGSPAFITKAMENCEKQIKALENFASAARRPFEQQQKLRRTWASIRFVATKQDIEEIQCRLRDAKLDLQFALSSNSWQLQMYHIQNTIPILNQIRQAQSACTLKFSTGQDEDEDFSGHKIPSLSSTNSMEHPSPSTKQEHVLWYKGIFGTIYHQKKSKCSKSTHTSAEGKAPLISETSWTLISSFVSYALQIRYARSFGHISRSFQIYPVMSHLDPVFELCRDGDLVGLQAALSMKRLSPFVTDDLLGCTLLHHAASYCQAEMCNWLLQVGLDAEATDNSGLKPLERTGWPGPAGFYMKDERASFGTHTVNTFRTLAQRQDDVSTSDFFVALVGYLGPPDGIDVLLSHSSLRIEHFDITEYSGSMPLLAIVLKHYSQNFFFDNTHIDNKLWWAYPAERKQWQPLIKTLIHKGADLHVPVPRKGFVPTPFYVNVYGTPLDVLFEFSGTPDEARTLGAEWLGLLASKGHNVIAYLKKEMVLHSPQSHMTYSTASSINSHPLALRELQYTFDNAQPCVWWEWWIDPASDIEPLEREFAQIVKHTSMVPFFVPSSWVDPWPFRFPVWHSVIEEVVELWPCGFENEGSNGLRRRGHVAMRRANRRLKKRHVKSMQSKGLRYPQVPGAWPV